ncbi:MAG: zf-TFIIB domain-containing protein [Anaerolineales bacterium]
MADPDLSEPLGTCPKCNGAFEALSIDAYTVDRCTTCGGLWLDERELEKVLAVDHRSLRQSKTASPPEATGSHKSSKCPRCGGTLIALTDLRANVVTDSCSVCYGVFLDAGELDAFDHPHLAGRIGQLLRKLRG